MGSGIAEVCARAGSEVIIHEIDAPAAEAAMARLGKSLDRAVERGKLEPA
ncbi:MAG TPA: 3-hydroxyacyl-CoA dehydrogenase NAD-binding domain-containing protein, partial [Acidimicrobiia bacterium]|nr:3-hydroxyacyl-CoA dehydrogenase NAD-binding domain-containing protein [Acidimicrobiia bacterium]